MSHNLRHRWTRWGAVALLAALVARHLFDEYRADATDPLNGLTVR